MSPPFFFLFLLQKLFPPPVALVLLLTSCGMKKGKNRRRIICFWKCGSFQRIFSCLGPLHPMLPNSPNPFHFQMPCGLFIGSRGGRNLSVFSHLYTGFGHSSEYSPLSLLAFLGLLFLRFITHVTDFRSLQSQGFRNMRPFQNYRCEAEGFEPDICSSFMGLNEIAALGDWCLPGPLGLSSKMGVPVTYMCFSFSAEIRISSVTYLALLSFLPPISS